MPVKSSLIRARTASPVVAFIVITVYAAAVGDSAKGAEPPRPERSHPSFVPVHDRPDLPRVLLIGDSISMQYTLFVREQLDGVANVHRPARNCRSTRQTLAEVDDYLGNQPWDVIHFNWGIHDVTHLGEDGKVASPPSGKPQVPLDEYERNINDLVNRLQKTGATLIWASTTPIGWQTETKGYRRDRDVVAYNAVAMRIMKAKNITTNDLYSEVQPRTEELVKDGVHFNEQGVRVLSEQVASAIRRALLKPQVSSTQFGPERDLSRIDVNMNEGGFVKWNVPVLSHASCPLRICGSVTR